MSENRNPFRCYDRRYLSRVLIACVLVVGISFSTRLLGLEKGSGMRIAIGVVQAVIFGYIIGITVATIRRLDELQYRIQLEAIAFAFAATGIAVTGWGFMTKAGLPSVDWGPETWLMMVLFWAVGIWLTRRRYE